MHLACGTTNIRERAFHKFIVLLGFLQVVTANNNNNHQHEHCFQATCNAQWTWHASAKDQTKFERSASGEGASGSSQHRLLFPCASNACGSFQHCQEMVRSPHTYLCCNQTNSHPQARTEPRLLRSGGLYFPFTRWLRCLKGMPTHVYDANSKWLRCWSYFDVVTQYSDVTHGSATHHLQSQDWNVQIGRSR